VVHYHSGTAGRDDRGIWPSGQIPSLALGLGLGRPPEHERQLLEPILLVADLVIDTSRMGVHALRDLIHHRVAGRVGRLSITFESFGFKHGIPGDADFVFDARSLPNPYWEPSLRSLTGTDAEVVRFLEAQKSAGTLIEDIVRFIDGRIPEYEAGNRGASWLKIKRVHTLDLVVLAAEWGYGRRTGKLSNLHLGALDPATGDYVMLGKTFKGLTDAMLAWQTREFLAREVRRDQGTVYIRPELVVEIAFSDLQASVRYPGGLALRLARVKRYRDDKCVEEADTMDGVRKIYASQSGAPKD